MKPKRPLTAALFVLVMVTLGVIVMLQGRDKNSHPAANAHQSYWQPADPEIVTEAKACVSGQLSALRAGDFMRSRSYFVSPMFYHLHRRGPQHVQRGRPVVWPHRMGTPEFGRCLETPDGMGAYIEVFLPDLKGRGNNAAYFLMKDGSRYRIYWLGDGDSELPFFLSVHIPPRAQKQADVLH